MFTKLSAVHSYRTRSVTNANYYVEQVRTENMKRAFSTDFRCFDLEQYSTCYQKKSIQKRTKGKTL